MDANHREPWRNLEPFLGADVPRNEVVLLSEVKAMCATLTAELAEALEQRDRLAQENLERAEAVIAQAANARNLADALKKLNNAARISGGVAGADKNLMDACENAERALSLAGTGRAVNAVLDVLEQRDSLRDECERLRVALREIAEWTDMYTTPGHPISTTARRALSASGRDGAAPAIANQEPQDGR